MSAQHSWRRSAAGLCAIAAIAAGSEFATVSALAKERAVEKRATTPSRITLAAAMKLAGADNLDIRIAQQRALEAQANWQAALEQFFPYVSPGFGYRRHENNIQTVEGRIINADKEQYTAGASFTAQVDLGDAVYRSLAARQLTKAAVHAADAQRQESVYQAAVAFLELARAQSAVEASRESVRIAEEYMGELRHAVEAGIAFKGEALRAEIQVQRNELSVRQSLEQRRLAAARLTQVLHLDPAVDLEAEGGSLTPLHLAPASDSLDSLVARALSSRPELKQYAAQFQAARKAREGAVYGPLVPTVGAQAFTGGLGGGVGSPGPDNFGQSSDFSAGVSWRLGPGGLFDFPRIRAADARMRTSELELERLRDEVVRQVVDAATRIQSLTGQIESSRQIIEAAQQGLTLARERRQFGVGEVIEAIQAEQDLTRARLEYINFIAEHNKAQFALKRAVGAIPRGDGPHK